MDLVLYTYTYEFHFQAGLRPLKLAEFLNSLPGLGFKFREGRGDYILDPESKPGVYSLHLKQYPDEENPIPSETANYYLRWSARSSVGDIAGMAREMARLLRQELESEIWLVDGKGHNRLVEFYSSSDSDEQVDLDCA